MSSLSWLRFARRLPGLSKQPEYPDLEALVEAEADKTSDEYHIARWVVPLILGTVGAAVFIPLSIFVSPYFLIGTGGLWVTAATLGTIFHWIAKGITPGQVALRKRTRNLRNRMIQVKNLLGFEPALSPKVGEVLDQAARYYLQVCHEETPVGMWPEARLRARAAMEEAMTRMLELTEPPNGPAQEAVLARGWAMPLLAEMKALAKAMAEHEEGQRRSPIASSDADALAGLREARVELERLDQATQELDLRQHQ
ncbi:MAG TPA: hypothetical protein PLX06_09430 [Fimbriimonadaceae bacterium]|nr:hypothetical protein [Fimbriimonadaceae bacterium]